MALIEVDQSGKWESKMDTAIGAAFQGKLFGALVSLKSKNIIEKVLWKFDQERNRPKKRLAIRMFTYSVFLTLRKIARPGDCIAIDEEYEGNENSIRDLLLHLFFKFENIAIKPSQVSFGILGKSSPSHKAAYMTFTRERRPDIILKFEDCFELLDRTEEIRKKAFDRRMKKRKSKVR